MIELGRYHLTFRLDDSAAKKIKWRCDQPKGFYLASTQLVPSLGNIKNFLLLTNDKNEKKVLIPANSLAKEKDGVLSGKIKLDPDLANYQQKYYTYDLKTKAGQLTQTLEPTSTSASLHLAYCLMGAGRYSEAKHYLSLHKLPLRGDMHNELQILKRIAEMRNITQDHNPKAVALRLNAVFCMKKC